MSLLKDPDVTFDLREQNEDLKGLLRANDLLLKDNEFKYTKAVENYELQLSRLRDENSQLKDKYEKIAESQRKLEKLNSSLEDRLLKIVEKYESEQKSLFEELTIAHSQLVEAKLAMNELEEEKESYRKDCNLAVNLLQCNPSEFVDHTYNTLPLDLKDRLRSYLSEDEIIRLETGGDNEAEINKQNSNSVLKIPIFQPTAAAAMMYNIQSATLQREKQKIIKQTNEMNSANHLIRSQSHSVMSGMGGMANYLSPASQATNSPLKQVSSSSSLTTESEMNSGKISSNIIAQILKKDSESKSKKSYKLLPYICLRCKKDVILCDSPTQTNQNDINAENSKIIYGNPRSILSRCKTIGNGLSKTTDSYHTNELNPNKSSSHQKCASLDLSSTNSKHNSSLKNFDLKIETEADSNSNEKSKRDSWSDLGGPGKVVIY